VEGKELKKTMMWVSDYIEANLRSGDHQAGGRNQQTAAVKVRAKRRVLICVWNW
jgi:hypothetical protein